MAINKTLAWQKLNFHALGRKTVPFNLRKAFAQDPTRATQMSVRTEHIYYDYSRQLVTPTTMQLLFGLAQRAGLGLKINAMFSGVKINTTEQRAVLHTALRQQTDESVVVDGVNVIPEVKAVLAKIKAFSEKVLSGEWKGVTGKPIKNIVAIGIGGSYLGPEYLAEACKAYAKPGMNLRFVANVDSADFANKIQDLNPEETMCVIVSKTFTTAETMKNAETARDWMMSKLGDKPEVISKHFVAVSTATEKVNAFGIDPANMFGFWDWGGGRYSATSAVGGVPLSLFLGYDKFEEILKGAYWMDQHFRKTAPEKNIPIISALIDIWNINFLGHRIRALLPYSQAAAKLPAHTQQVEMESNGKRVDLLGEIASFATGEVVFGEPGTNGQHSFYQLIHQGMVVPADFIGFISSLTNMGKNSATSVSHQMELNCNFLAQPDALAFGQENSEPHKFFPGNRPSSSLLLEQLDPFTAGALLALTEHRTAVKGFIWGINSFDQWGVQLGKVLGVDMRNRMLKYFAGDGIDTAGLNSSTATMLEAVLTGKLPR